MRIIVAFHFEFLDNFTLSGMSKTVHVIYILLLVAVGLSAAAFLTVSGFEYYSLPLTERPFHPQHHSLEPAGGLGHGLGIAGTLMMILGVSSYMARKRVRAMFRWGFLKHWLEFHIFLCSVGPLLVLFHTAFKFGGIVAVSFWSMAAVVASGVIGRFIYTQLPRSIEGNEMSAGEIESLNSELTAALKNEEGLSALLAARLEAIIEANTIGSMSLTRAMGHSIVERFTFRKKLGELRRELESAGLAPEIIGGRLLPKLRLKLSLARKKSTLQVMQKLFRYWHIFHLPFAISMFVIMLIHVGVTILFGYRWIF